MVISGACWALTWKQRVMGVYSSHEQAVKAMNSCRASDPDYADGTFVIQQTTLQFDLRAWTGGFKVEFSKE